MCSLSHLVGGGFLYYSFQKKNLNFYELIISLLFAVFYVTDQKGNKLRDVKLIENIQTVSAALILASLSPLAIFFALFLA